MKKLDELFSSDLYGLTSFHEYLNELKADKDTGITAASFFSGCGGLDLGLHWAGIKTIFANEIDANASSTYKNNLQHDPVCSSIKIINPDSIPEVDMFVGGFPCQPFSYSGKRRGLTDTRGTLFYDFANLIKAKKPKYLILENVAGLQKHDKGQTFNTIIEILNTLNYHIFHKILDSSDFGIPQIRRRLFIVGVSKALDNGKQFVFPQQSSRKIGVKEAIDDLICNTSVANNEPMQHRQNTIMRFSKIPAGGTWRDVPEEHKPRLRGDPTKITHKKLRLQSHQRLHPDEPCFTITANIQTHFIHYSQNRNLTPREAARLQSFPDWFEFSGKRSFMSWDKELCQYQQIGNAVPPLLGRALGRALVSFIKN